MGARPEESRLAHFEPFVCHQKVFTPSEGRFGCHFERFIDRECGKADEKRGVHGVPLSRLRDCVGVSGFDACKMVALWRPSQRRRCHARQTGL